MNTALKIRVIAVWLLGLSASFYFRRDELANHAIGKTAYLAAQAERWERLYSINHSVVAGIMATVSIVAIFVALYEGVVWVVQRVLVAIAKFDRSGAT
jgi:hypothetical protein